MSTWKRAAGALFLGAALVLRAPAADAQAYDLVLRNARIVDGTGSPWYRADLAVRGDTIARIAPAITDPAARVIDLGGLAVAPGFIDLHTHAARGIFQVPTADNYVRQGVTTILEGPDGGSPVPLKPFLDKLEALPKSLNIASFLGQGSVREAVIGLADRPASAQELERMRALGEQGMRGGALARRGRDARPVSVHRLQHAARGGAASGVGARRRGEGDRSAAQGPGDPREDQGGDGRPHPERARRRRPEERRAHAVRVGYVARGQEPGGVDALARRGADDAERGRDRAPAHRARRLPRGVPLDRRGRPGAYPEAPGDHDRLRRRGADLRPRRAASAQLRHFCARARRVRAREGHPHARGGGAEDVVVSRRADRARRPRRAAARNEGGHRRLRSGARARRGHVRETAPVRGRLCLRDRQRAGRVRERGDDGGPARAGALRPGEKPEVKRLLEMPQGNPPAARHERRA